MNRPPVSNRFNWTLGLLAAAVVSNELASSVRAQVDFRAARSFGRIQAPGSLAVADMSRDGVLDAVVVEAGANRVLVLLGDGVGSFFPLQAFSVGNGASAVVTADFDHDGKRDVVVADTDDDAVAVLLGTGGGSLAAAQHYAAGPAPVWIAVADFNADTHFDLAVANRGAAPGFQRISILFGDGAGRFAVPQTIPLGVLPNALVAADLDRDGNTDLAVATGIGVGTGDVRVLLGDGAGQFGAPRLFPLGATFPSDIVAADFNRDGILDLVTVNPSSSDATLLLGAGDGSFGAPSQVGSGFYSSSIAVGDLDRDGNLDLVVADAFAILTLHGDGAGAFAAAESLGSGTSMIQGTVVVADVDGDGDLDLVGRRGNAVTAFSGNGAGQFDLAPRFPAGNGPVSAAVADFDEDGRLDVAVADGGSRDVTLLLGSGAGGLTSAGTLFGLDRPYRIIAADLDLDGHADLAVATWPDIAPGGVRVRYGDGAAGFGVTVDLSFPSDVVLYVASGDFNRDGIPDLAAGTGESLSGHIASVWICLGAGGRSFLSPRSLAQDPGFCIATADFDGDDDLDLAIGKAGEYPNNGHVALLLGDGAGSFVASPQEFEVERSPECIVAADFDGDGDPDLAVGNSGSASCSVLMGDGSGAFAPARNLQSGQGRGIAAVDLDADGALDLVLSDVLQARVVVHHGGGGGGFASLHGFLAGDSPSSVVAADMDADGRPDLVVTNENSDDVSVLLNRSTSCLTGGVNAALGTLADVLLVNGSAGDANRVVRASVGSPIQLSLAAAPAGPNPAKYVFWVWLGGPLAPMTLSAGGRVIGCTVNPTPFQYPATPQPFRCLRGGGVPSVVCAHTTGLPSAPASAPWTLTRHRGFSTPIRIVQQGVIRDDAASNPQRVSVTNAVILDVQ